VIDRALTLAGVPPAQPATLREVAAVTGTGRGAVLVGAAGIATAVAQAAPAIQALGTLAPAVAIAVIVAAVVGVLAWRLRRPA
jgi:Mg/Co/Ni transporter MgtE